MNRVRRTLAALLVVGGIATGAAVLSNPPGTDNSEATCQFVLNYFPYPHYVWTCSGGGGGGGSW